MSTTAPAQVSLKQRAAKVLPSSLVDSLDRFVFSLRRNRIRFTHWFFGLFGQNVVARKDYYSTLPVLSEIEATRERWEKPSDLAGLDINVNALEKNLGELAENWETEFRGVAPDHAANAAKGFGPGYPAFDARTLYYVLR
ncbi:MAG: hypothetical protein ACJ72D_25450 [Marmoricola sp.]